MKRTELRIYDSALADMLQAIATLEGISKNEAMNEAIADYVVKKISTMDGAAKAWVDFHVKRDQQNE